MNIQELKSIFSRLSDAPGISGVESQVREIIKAELEGIVDEIKVDRLGNLITKKGNGKSKVMLAAHMDEIGFRVKSITENGFIRFAKSGGIDDRCLLNQGVMIYTKSEPLKGVIGSKPPHLLKEEERKKIIESMDMYIDVGVTDKTEVESLGIEIGDPIVFDTRFSDLGNRYLVKGKAFDDRAGCLVMIEIMKHYEGNITLYGVGTTQEEVGLKGVRTSTYEIEPDIGIALDVTTTGDTPDVKLSESTNKIGMGPVITIAEAGGRGLITDEHILRLFIDTAKTNNIPYQVEVGEGGMSDAAILYITKTGVPTGAISIPARYIHSSNGIVHLGDVENTITLLIEALKKIDNVNN